MLRYIARKDDMVVMDLADEQEDYGTLNELGESPLTICSPKIPMWSRLYINSQWKQIREVVTGAGFKIRIGL